MGRLIKIFEHEKLTLHADSWGRKMTKTELDKLYDFNDRNGNVYFTGIRDGVKFNSYVGVIQIGGLIIEILPKADKQFDKDKEDLEVSAARWRNVLLTMLAACQKIKLEAVTESNLHRRYHSILDMYFEIFLDEVAGLLKKGLIRNYQITHANVTSLKGRLDFNRNIGNNIVHRERFYTHHQVYTFDHLINQILIRAIHILNRISSNPDVRDKLARIKLDLPDISDCKIQKHHFEKIPVNRKTEPYREALKIARMLILNYSPDIKSGQENMLALLFDMNQLWEEFIFRKLVRSKPEDCEVFFQNSQVFWQNHFIKKSIRPDIVVSKLVDGRRENFIIDTKWKIIDMQNPGDDDLKQMYVYNMYWDASKCMLLYPRTFPGSESWGEFPKGRDNENRCKLGFIDVLNLESSGLNRRIGEEIFMKLFDDENKY